MVYIWTIERRFEAGWWTIWSAGVFFTRKEARREKKIREKGWNVPGRDLRIMKYMRAE